MKPTLSIIVAAHREGLIAHKTMLSLQRAAEMIRAAGVKYEVIITVDNGDQVTHEYFNRYENDKNITVHKVSFGELAASRNYGVSIAKGDYIATLDADDLVSVNWFVDSINLLKTLTTDSVLHTQYSINFGTQDVIWEKFNSKSKEEDAVIMTWANRWDSAVIAPRSVFEKFPYQPNNGGYGSEDWHFNSETLADNIPHIVTPETILFVRRKDVSMMTVQAADRRTVRFTNLLDFDSLRKIDTSHYTDVAHTSKSPTAPLLMEKAKVFTKNSLRYVHRKAKNVPVYRRGTQKLIATVKSAQQPEAMRFPTWLMDEWRAVHQIDKSIFPDEHLVQNIPLYHSEMYELGVTFVNLAKHLTKKPDYIIFIPHLTKAGAELVALHYIRAIKKAHPTWNLAIVATELGDNSWREQLPNDVDFVPYGEMTHHLPEQLRLQLLARFIVQSQATHLHISQSPLMFRFAELYKTLLVPYIVYAFAFCEDTDNQGRIAGHVHSGLPYAYDTIDTIFTDCAAIAQSLQTEYGYDDSKFITHYQPVTTKIQPARIRPEGSRTLRVLWASRIAKQKRPDILVEIAKRLDGSAISIDVYGSFQDGFSQDLFKGLNAIAYKGTFNGIDSIPTHQYDAFVYTSENDGIPNIILETSAKGLPVIAPDVGGISEFITDKTGILIDTPDDVDAYIQALQLLSLDERLRKSLVSAAQKKLATQHALKRFEELVSQDVT